MDVNRQDQAQPRIRRLWLPRRRFLQALLGLLGGLGLPARAQHARTISQAKLRKADFYRTKEQTRRR
jgi:hypothetical protein